MRAADPLRRAMRTRRRALSAAEQSRRAHDVAEHGVHLLTTAPSVVRVTTLGTYRPFDGELDPVPLVVRLAPAITMLPVCAGEVLRWAPFDDDTAFVANRYGIDEPTGAGDEAASSLDLVLVPVVAFDAAGHRVGMGAGWYDRTFGPLAPEDRPVLVGLAHDEQEVDAIEPHPWDVALDAVVTPTRAWWVTA